MRRVIVFLLLVWSTGLLADECGLRQGQLSGTLDIIDVPDNSGITQLNSSLYCNGDFVINVVSRTEAYDGSIELDLKILNGGISDGVLEVMAPKGTSGLVTQRYFLPGRRPMSASLAQHLNIHFDSENVPVSAADPAHPYRWIRLSLVLPYKGWLSLQKSSDLPAAASLVRIALENILESKQTFIITPDEFWGISQRVGVNAAGMLRKHVIENTRASWGEKVDLSLTVINGLITSLVHKNNDSVAGSINGVFQLAPAEMETAYEMMGWPVDVSASYDFEDTLNEFGNSQAALVVNNDYVIPDTVIPMRLAGVWEGSVQISPRIRSPGIANSSYSYTPFRIDIDPIRNIYVTSYPELGCKGYLIFNNEKDAVYTFNERLIENAGNCIGGGYVNLMDNTEWAKDIFYYWEHPGTGNKEIGGSIKRTKTELDEYYMNQAQAIAQVNIGQAIAAVQDQREYPGYSLVYEEFSTRFDPFDRFIYMHRFEQNKLSIVLALQEILPYFRDLSDVTITNQDRLSAVEDALLVIADHIGLSLEEFKLLSDGRNMYQSASIAYSELTPEEGWVLLPEAKSAFHMIGLDGGNIEKWVNEDGREYVFFNTQDRMILVIDGKNDGTFNYANDSEPIAHFGLDMLPWLLWGVGLHDRMTADERMNVWLESGLHTDLSAHIQNFMRPRFTYEFLGTENANSTPSIAIPQ